PGFTHSAGQTPHVLLSRSPLEYLVQAQGLSVRLACIRHAASVHPEPGSNSPQKIISFQRKSFRISRIERCYSLLITIQLLRCLFNCEGRTLILLFVVVKGMYRLNTDVFFNIGSLTDETCAWPSPTSAIVLFSCHRSASARSAGFLKCVANYMLY